MIIVPPSAKRDPAFGNKLTMLVGDVNVVFDDEFGVIHLVHEERGHLAQFDNNVALDRHLDELELRVRYHTINLPFHAGGIDDYLHEMAITIENKVEEPYDVEFSGSRFSLMCLVNDHYAGFCSEPLEFERLVATIQGTTPDYGRAG